jgi:hypothetical protein
VSPLAFLLVALAISVVGSLVLWLRNRRPRSLSSGINDFRREMRALAPGEEPGVQRGPGDARG